MAELLALYHVLFRIQFVFRIVNTSFDCTLDEINKQGMLQPDFIAVSQWESFMLLIFPNEIWNRFQTDDKNVVGILDYIRTSVCSFQSLLFSTNDNTDKVVGNLLFLIHN